MRVAAVLLIAVGLFTAGQAQFSTDDLANVGKTLVDSLVQKGKELLTDAASNLLSNLLSGDLFGKRDLGRLTMVGNFVKDVTSKLKDLADQGKEMAASVFTKTMNKLKALAERYHAAIGTIKNAEDIAESIDAVVADHHTKQKRILGSLIEKGKEILSGAYDTVKQVASKLKEHASNLVSGALQTGVDIFGKRDLSDHLRTIGDALAGAVSPFKDIVDGLGTTLKGHFSNLVDTVQGHVDALKTKLDPHLTELKGHGQKLLDHGKNALSALSEVVGDILNQTVDNASDSISGIANTVGEAGKTVVGHFAGTDDSSSY